jgi:hypothetical protein
LSVSVETFAVLLALGAFVRVWREGARGLRTAVAGLFVGAIVLAYPAYTALRTKAPRASSTATRARATPAPRAASAGPVSARGLRTPVPPCAA